MTQHNPESADNFVMLRRGLRDHVVSGRVSFFEAGIFQDLLIQADPKTGTLHSNATILSSQLGESRRKVQDALCALKRGKYIHYDDVRGVRGPHEIFIDKFPCWIQRRNWKDAGVWFSRIWDDAGVFIGRSIFFGRLKVRNMGSILTIWGGMMGVLSIRGFGFNPDFKLDFRSDYAEWSKNLDILCSCADFCEWLSDFQGDFQRDFHVYFKNSPISISINIFKDHPARGKNHSEKGTGKNGRRPSAPAKGEPAITKTELTPAQRNEAAELCGGLRVINHGFKPEAFVGRCMGKGIPGAVIIDVLRSMDAKKETIEQGWAYANKVLAEKMQAYEHEANKRMGIGDLQKLEVID